MLEKLRALRSLTSTDLTSCFNRAKGHSICRADSIWRIQDILDLGYCPANASPKTWPRGWSTSFEKKNFLDLNMGSHHMVVHKHLVHILEGAKCTE